MDLESQIAHIKHVHGPEEVTYGPEELIVVCLERNGRPYLKSFVEHYFSLGVKHIVFLDNGSTDGMLSAAQNYENITVLHTDLPFKEIQFALRRYLIERFGKGRWILCVDMDELFDYPYSDVVSLGSFLRYLTEKSYTAVVAHMLDMFPEKPLMRATNIEMEDEPLKELHRFYDISNVKAQDYRLASRGVGNTVASDEIEIYKGGIQETLFGQRALFTKHPLIFLDEEIRPMEDSVHWVSGAHVADVTCVLFHYKFIGDLYERALLNVREENHWNNSLKYKRYLEVLQKSSELQIKQEGSAQEIKDVNDLVDNQFLVVSGDYLSWVDADERKGGAEALGGGPRRLVEAFCKASARARIQTRRSNLNRRVEELENSLATEKRKRIEMLERMERKNRRIETLEKRNHSLERQILDIQASRSWKMLERLGRIRARMVGKGRR